MLCFHYFIFFCFFNGQILQLKAFDEEHNDIFAELWQKSEEISTESGKCEETLQNSNENFRKIEKIKKEIVVKDEPNDNNNNDFKLDQFSNERQQKIALNKTVKEENVEKRIKSEFIEFDRISNKEEFDDNEKDGEEQNTDSIFDNSNLKESSSKSQKGLLILTKKLKDLFVF
ncbi:hypothetical protein GPALN_010286 [Globodera pallida]|nr:hypothetical protein GPALN_010286 [Globodera pallida]